MFHKIKANIPNAITCLNLLAGCMAIIFSFSALRVIDGHLGFHMAFACIMIGATADFFDGFCARLLHAYSPLGAQLDSLSDLVTFGVAPAMIAFNLLLDVDVSMTMALIVLLLPLCGAIRLARFNVDDSQTISFRGLPIPSAALFTIGVCEMLAYGVITPHVAIISIAACALMMVVRVRLLSLKFKSYSFSLTNLFRYSLLIAAIIFCVVWRWAGLASTILFYIIASIILNISKPRY